MLERKSQIENLKREFPKLKSWGFRPVIFTIPVSSFFGKSSCLLEINIPRKYPKERVSFKLVNPIPHKWSQWDAINCPNDLYEKPITDIIWAIVSHFNDYEKYCSGSAVEPTSKVSTEDSKRNIPKKSGRDSKPKNEIHESVLKVMNNPPKGPIHKIINATDDEVDKMLKDEYATRAIIYSTDEMKEVLVEAKKVLSSNEEIVSNILQSLNKRETLINSVKDTIELLKKTDYSHLSKSATSTSGILSKIEAEISNLLAQVSENEKMVESGNIQYEDARDSLFELHGRINRLSALHISISNSC